MPSPDGKKRAHASIACAACRTRRTKCIVGPGQSSCDRCLRRGQRCVIRDDDQRRKCECPPFHNKWSIADTSPASRPISRSSVSTLVTKLETLQSLVRDAGLVVPDDIALELRPLPSFSGSDAAHRHDLEGNAAPRLLSHTENGDTTASEVSTASWRASTDIPSYLTNSPATSTSPLSLIQTNPAPEPTRRRYFGVTTNYHICSTRYHSENSSTRRELELSDVKASALLNTLSSDVAGYLLDCFWSYWNSVIPLVHRDAFELDQLRNGRRYYSPFLHIIMLALGFRYADKEKIPVYQLSYGECESTLHFEAKTLVDHELKSPGGIPSLQAVLLLGDLECGAGRYNTGWLYAGRDMNPNASAYCKLTIKGMATRLCFDLGLNRDYSDPESSWLDIEARSTALWGCVTLDRCLCLHFVRCYVC
jgi:hypothetical protein